MGHSIIKPFPALVQLKLEAPFKGYKGVKFEGMASINIGEYTLRKEKGEILFTNYGISGPQFYNLAELR